MAGRGGHRLGAGRKRRQVSTAKPVSSEILKFAEAVFKGIALSALPLAPDASDDELVQIGLSDMVLNEIKRGRGGEILRLTGNIVSMLAAAQGEESESGSGSALADAMSRMPGVECAPSTAPQVEIMGSGGRSVRELASLLKSHEAGGRSIAPRQSELFDQSLPGVILN